MRFILDDGTEVSAEKIMGPCVLFIQPLEKWTPDELFGLGQGIESLKDVFKRHKIDVIMGNADLKLTVIRDPIEEAWEKNR